LNTWIFQGNPTKFNVDDFLLENDYIWWSIKQKHLAEQIQLNDIVFIWRSDGGSRGSGGIVARTQVMTLPLDYTNANESAAYWYEEPSDETYLAVELKVLEVEVNNVLKRTSLQIDNVLKDLPILKLRQNTNYLLENEMGAYLNSVWTEKFSILKTKTVNTYELPELKPSGRIREYNFYSDALKAKVIFQHLIHNETHRSLDKKILGIQDGRTKGRNSANILYYLGMKADYRGIFQGKELYEVILILEEKGKRYSEVVRLLRLLDDIDLDRSIDSDIEAEQVEDGHGIEGNQKYYFGKRYERDAKNRKMAIKIHGLNCYVCNFNFEKVYGERGKDFIEVHHLKPLSTLGEAVEINPETELVPLCANCHRMVHRRKDNVLSIDELKAIHNLVDSETKI